MNWRILLTVAAAAMTCCAWAQAQNVTWTETFDDNVDGWLTETYSSVVHSPLDANGSGTSGSAEVANFHPSNNNGLGIRKCVTVDVTAGDLYIYGGAMFIPTGQTETGKAMVGLRWYDGVECSGSQVGSQPRLQNLVLGSWVALHSTTQEAPAGAVSVLYVAFPSKVEAGGTLVSNFDNLFFVSDEVFSDGFESADTDLWSAVTP